MPKIIITRANQLSCHNDNNCTAKTFNPDTNTAGRLLGAGCWDTRVGRLHVQKKITKLTKLRFQGNKSRKQKKSSMLDTQRFTIFSPKSAMALGGQANTG